jgi:hypothetical protein
MSGKWKLLWLCFVVLVLGGTAALAQTITGSVRGTVTDPSGAVVAGAKVAVTNIATGVANHTVSDPSGAYDFQFLNLGDYTVTVSASGFETSSIGPFRLQIDQIAQIDAKLQVGAAAITVNVASSAGAILNTENATLGTSFSAHALETMPLPGQNVLYATMFVPGALNPTVASMSTAYRNTSWDDVPSFNGNRQQGNNFVLDGIEINETTENLSGYNPAPQSLQEIRTITGNSDAEFGNVDGAEVLMVTKAGTNQFHGSVYEYFENQDFQADSYGNHYNNIPQADFGQNLFGGAVGGPIFRNKLFFFGDYEGLQFSNPGTGLASVPSALERTGNFSEVDAIEGNPIFNTTGGTNTEFQYDTGGVLDKIPILNPVANYLFANPQYLPVTNHAPNPGSVTLNNYTAPVTYHKVNNQGDGRLDYTLSSHDTLMIKGTYGDAYDNQSNAIIPVEFPLTDNYPFAMGVVDWIHTFSPSLVNEFRPGYSRIIQDTETLDPSGGFGTNGDTTMDIGHTGNQPLPGFAYILQYYSDNSSFGTQGSAGTKTIDNNFDFGDDLTWVHGKHITRMGAQFVRYQENYISPSNIGGENGTFAYFEDYTANYYGGGTAPCCGAAAAYSNGDSFADFELDSAEVATVAGVTGPFGARQWRDAYYAQDDWKVLPNLTLNLGLRYAYDQPMYEAHDKMASINLVTARFAPVLSTGRYTPATDPYVELAGMGGNSRALVNPYYKQFMPRLGFAWHVNPRLVLRGGYSITDDDEGTGTGLRMTQNPPFLTSVTNLQHGPQATYSIPISVTNGLTSGTGGTPPSAQYDVWDPNFRPATVQQFNLTTQYLLASKTSLQVGYVGQIGQHLAEPRLLNQYTGQVPATCGPSDTTGCVDVVAPYYAVVGGNSNIVDTVSEGNENYHALQATLHQQETNGLEYTVNYTWSKAMNDSSGGYFNVDGVGSGGTFAFPQDSYNPHADYGPANFDARHNISGTAVYQLPFGQEKRYGSHWNRATDELIGGWELSANAMYHTGFPATMIETGANTGLNAASDNGNYNYAGRLNQYRPMKIVGQSALNWWGTDPSATPCKTGVDNGVCAYGKPASGTFGDAHNGTERNPGFRNVDLSLFKGFRTAGHQYFKFRVDAYNVFNLDSWEAPNSRAGSGQYGKIVSSSSNPRQFQISGVYTF